MTLPLTGIKAQEFQEKIGTEYDSYYPIELQGHTYWFFSFGYRNIYDFSGFSGVYFFCPVEESRILLEDVIFAHESQDIGSEMISKKPRKHLDLVPTAKLYVCFEEEPYSEERRQILLKEFLRKHPTHFMSGTHIS